MKKSQASVKSKLRALGNGLFSLLLVVSLTPSAAAYGDTNDSPQNNEALVSTADEEGTAPEDGEIIADEAEHSADTTGDAENNSSSISSNKVESGAANGDGLFKKSQAQTETYVGMDMAGDGTWMVGVTVTSPAGGLPSADDGEAGVLCEQVGSDELAKAIAASYDGDAKYALGLRLTLVSTEDGSAVSLPEGSAVRVRLIDLGSGKTTKAFSLEGGALSPLDSYVFDGDGSMDDPANGIFDVAVDGLSSVSGATFAWVDTDGLSEKSQAQTSLAPGVYSVCANLFVKGENNAVLSGITAYLTGLSIPPTLPCQTNNATLTVGDDKSLTLKLDLDTYPSEVFTLQDIQSGNDIEVESVVRGVGPKLDKYVANGNPDVFKVDRIRSLTLKLKNASGEYSFGDCAEFPTLVGKDMTMPLNLTVDFDSAKKGFDAGDKTVYEKSFTDAATGITATVHTIETNLGEALGSAVFSARLIDDADQLSQIESSLSEEYASIPGYDAFTCAFENNGVSLSFEGNTLIEYSVPWEKDAAAVYAMAGDSLSSLDSELANGMCVFSDPSATSFVVLDSGSAYKWLSKTELDAPTKVIASLSISTYHEFAEGWLGLARFNAKSEEQSDGSVKYLLSWTNDAGEEGNNSFNLIPGTMKASFTIPVNEGQGVYLITDNGSSLTAKKVAEGSSVGNVTFDLFSKDATKSDVDSLSESMYRAVEGASPSVEAPIAYFVVRSSGSDVANDPQAKTELTYTGLPQFGLNIDENVVCSGGDSPLQVNAGEYTTKVKPKNGYAWFDGTSDERTVEWSIDKTSIGAAYRSSLPYNAGVDEIPSIEEVANNLELSGFVNGETAATAEDFSISLIQSADIKTAIATGSLESGTRYWYYVNLEAKNYKLDLNKASCYVSVGVTPDKDAPTHIDLTYNGTLQAACAGNFSSFNLYEKDGEYIQTARVQDAGTYTFTAKPIYAWSDGGTESRTVTVDVAPATLRATYSGDTVTTVRDEAKGEVSVFGFVGDETSDSVEGFELPTVSIPEALTPGESYQLTPAGGNAGKNYQFEYVPGTLAVASSYVSEKLAPGTYTVTANLAMPGEFNPIMKGFTVYANNPNNPFTDAAGNSPVVDENSDVAATSDLPTAAMSDNATLIVDEDGTKTLVLVVRNSCFTVQELGTCPELSDVKVERTTPEDTSLWTYGQKSSRIHKIAITLPDKLTAGERSYDFAGSYLYAVPLESATQYGSADPNIRPEGDCALRLTVNYSSLKKQSASTNVPTLVDLVDKGGHNNSGNNNSGSNNNQNNSGTNGSNGSNGATNNGGSIGTTDNGHLAAGTYTVSGNIWFDKSVTGLPLNPHLSNGGFPPSSPVASNATLVVDGSGHAYVRIPVAIQDKVMTIHNVWGSGVSYDGSAVTIDLGTPSADQTTFTGTCQASVTIGWLAQTIAAGIFNGVWDHTWTANWEVDLGSTLPASGGGTLPAAAQAILAGINGVADEQSAAEAALAALDENGLNAKKGASQDASAEDDAAEGGISPAVIAGIALGVVAVAGIAAWAIVARKKRAAADGGNVSMNSSK